MAFTLCVFVASAAQLEGRPPTPAPTPAPGLGEAIVDFYSDAVCTESRLLYSIRFPNADGYCGESGRQWYFDSVEGDLNQWGAAFCDFQSQKLYIQVGIGDQKSCQHEIPDQPQGGGGGGGGGGGADRGGIFAKLKSAFSVALDNGQTYGCNKWDMPDPNNNNVAMTVGTRLRAGSCVPPTPPPGANTASPAGQPPAKCGVWPKAPTYGCSGGGTYEQLSTSGDQTECTVDCLDKASEMGSSLCCYLGQGGVGCFAKMGGKVEAGKPGDVGLAVECIATNPHPGPGSTTPSPGHGGKGHGGSSSQMVIIAVASGGSVLLLLTAAAIAWYLKRTGRIGDFSCGCCDCCGDSDDDEERPLLTRLRSLCSCCKEQPEELPHESIFNR